MKEKKESTYGILTQDLTVKNSQFQGRFPKLISTLRKRDCRNKYDRYEILFLKSKKKKSRNEKENYNEKREDLEEEYQREESNSQTKSIIDCTYNRSELRSCAWLLHPKSRNQFTGMSACLFRIQFPFPRSPKIRFLSSIQRL